jgi:hypothetical protein
VKSKIHSKLITPKNWRDYNALYVNKDQEQWAAPNIFERKDAG